MKSFKLFLLIFSCLREAVVFSNEFCTELEVALVLDVSKSLTPDDFRKEKLFTKAVVSGSIAVGESTRFGVVTFADDARKEIYCNDYYDFSSLQSKIDNLSQYGAFTNIEDGLRLGQQILNEQGCGNNDNTKRAIILLTDGEANRGGGIQALFDEAKRIRDAGTVIYAVGVGQYVSIEQLTKITGDSSKLILPKDFSDLVSESILEQLAVVNCNYTTPAPSTTETPTTTPTTTTTTTTTTSTPTTTAPITTTTTPTTTTITTTPTTTTARPTTTVITIPPAAIEFCTELEVALVLDVSASLTPDDFGKEKLFTKAVVSGSIGVGESTHFGVVTFADDARKEIYCNDYYDLSSLQSKIDNLSQYGAFTNIEDGLRLGQQILNERGCGNKSNAKRAIILLTDGAANRGGGLQALFDEAKRIRDAGTVIYAVGVGQSVSIEQLTKITGDSSKLILPKDFSDLVSESILEQLAVVNCNYTTPAPSTTETPTTTITTTTPTTTTSTTTTTAPTTTTTTPIPTTTTPTTTTTTTTTTPTAMKTTPITIATTTTPTTTTPTTTTPTTTTTTTAPTTTTTTTTPTTTTTTTTATTTAPTSTTATPTTTTTVTTVPPATTVVIPCTCNITHHTYLCSKWTKVEIINKFDGDCYLDKLKTALDAITNKISSLVEKLVELQMCKSQQMEFITNNIFVSSEFMESYDQCVVNINCKLLAWKNFLESRKTFITNEIQRVEDGWWLSQFSNIYS